MDGQYLSVRSCGGIYVLEAESPWKLTSGLSPDSSPQPCKLAGCSYPSLVYMVNAVLGQMVRGSTMIGCVLYEADPGIYLLFRCDASINLPDLSEYGCVLSSWKSNEEFSDIPLQVGTGTELVVELNVAETICSFYDIVNFCFASATPELYDGRQVLVGSGCFDSVRMHQLHYPQLTPVFRTPSFSVCVSSSLCIGAGPVVGPSGVVEGFCELPLTVLMRGILLKRVGDGDLAMEVAQIRRYLHAFQVSLPVVEAETLVSRFSMCYNPVVHCLETLEPSAMSVDSVVRDGDPRWSLYSRAIVTQRLDEKMRGKAVLTTPEMDSTLACFDLLLFGVAEDDVDTSWHPQRMGPGDEVFKNLLRVRLWDASVRTALELLGRRDVVAGVGVMFGTTDHTTVREYGEGVTFFFNPRAQTLPDDINLLPSKAAERDKQLGFFVGEAFGVVCRFVNPGNSSELMAELFRRYTTSKEFHLSRRYEGIRTEVSSFRRQVRELAERPLGGRLGHLGIPEWSAARGSPFVEAVEPELKRRRVVDDLEELLGI